jgi:hypothetical protein
MKRRGRVVNLEPPRAGWEALLGRWKVLVYRRPQLRTGRHLARAEDPDAKRATSVARKLIVYLVTRKLRPFEICL